MSRSARYDLVVAAEFINELVFMLPRFRICDALKSLFLRTVYGAKVGKRVVYYRGVWIFTGRNLEVGDDVDFARNVLITSDGGVKVGDRTLVGYGAMIISRNHRIPVGGSRIFGAGHVPAPVEIGKDAWIGACAVILPGSSVGEGAVVAAGSVVTRDIPAFEIWGGAPARFIRSRVES